DVYKRQGVTRYTPTPSKPRIELEGVSIGGRDLVDFDRLPRVPLGQSLSLRYRTTDMLTMPTKRLYRTKLTRSDGQEAGRTLLEELTSNNRREVIPVKSGRYELLIEAVDRGLNYSNPVRLGFVVYTPWYMNTAVMGPGCTAVCVLVVWLIVIYRRYLQHQRMARLLQEQMLRQEQQARRELETKNRELEYLNSELTRHELELRKALDNIKTLRGLLPICSYCKRIRNDKGFWQKVESYIDEHSEAKLTHGICPECMRKHFPEIAGETEGQGTKNQP
ncbi:MAG: hypothetical protein N3G20_11730, partial [Verrucomicrobiae bacterium]|nr:hypothetical protein [Verrucomicrobiae bacterium]